MSLHAPRLKEPRRALQLAMARRAKTSHLGAFQLLPEHVLLSCCAILPREDHDAVADCSTGFRAVMRSERFLKARRAEDINEEALVVMTGAEDFGFLALVSGRVWRRLPPMPAEMRPASWYGPNFRVGTTVIGSEVFLVSDCPTRDGREAGVVVYDAVDDEWFTMPLPPSHPGDLFAVGCCGELFIGGVWTSGPSTGQVPLWRWDAEAQKWIELPPMPPTQLQSCSYQLIALGVGLEIFVLDRCDPVRFRVFDTETETWSSVNIPLGSRPANPRDCEVTGDIRSHPWPSLWVDRSLIHLSHHGYGGHMAYDTANGHWILVHGHMPRHTVSSESSDRILSVVNHHGPDDYIHWQIYNSARWRGGVRVYDRRGTNFIRTDEPEVDLPVLYNVVERVCYVAMP